MDSSKIISSNIHFNGKLIKVRTDLVQLDSDKISTYEIVEHRPAVAIVPIDNQNNIHLVNQRRHAVNASILEIPAGLIEQNESPHVAALRELQEEIGYTSNDIRAMGSFWSSPGFTNEYLYTFVARDLVPSKLPQDEDENIMVEKIPFTNINDLIAKGTIKDAKSIAALLMAKYIFLE
jgi:ADP-ribose pyrophosphatase